MARFTISVDLSYTTHEDYTLDINATHFLLIHDIALVETVATIQFNSFVAPIALHPGFIADGVRAVASGWGNTNVSESNRKRILSMKLSIPCQDNITNLKFIHLNTLNNDAYRDRMEEALNKTGLVHDFSTLCAFSGRMGHGICLEDAGGPLVVDNKLIGVITWIYGCGMGHPDGFARVSTYID